MEKRRRRCALPAQSKACEPIGAITWARASFNSVRGKITSDWKRSGREFILRVTVPPGTIATVHLPSRSAAAASESGANLKQAKAAELIRQDGDRSVIQVASGEYEFRSQW